MFCMFHTFYTVLEPFNGRTILICAILKNIIEIWQFWKNYFCDQTDILKTEKVLKNFSFSQNSFTPPLYHLWKEHHEKGIIWVWDITVSNRYYL